MSSHLCSHGKFTSFQTCSLVSLLCIFFISSIGLFAQRPLYHITAVIDTFSTDTITGVIDIDWTNRSGSPVDRIPIHLWPNAYASRNSTLSQQMVEHGNFSLLHAADSDLGGIYNLAFKSSGIPIELNIDENNIDLGWLILNTPLNPFSTIHLSSPYKLIVPKSFSRIGRTGDSYQLTQWYPHIPVFDSLGWHTMPYLDQGEYYNDFADYDVKITVPERFKVAATGVLQETKQKGKLYEWTFKASNVIDFAWFASPTFRHETLKVDVGLKDPVELNIYIDPWLNNNWKSAVLYGERALKFYSDWLGPYPYPQMSVVYAPYSKGGFMEYPMIAQIGVTEDAAYLDRVIAHEIGHTWLYAILASDERTNPWMDEGFNSFMEQQYMQTYYKDAEETIFPSILHSEKSMVDNDAVQHSVRLQNQLQPPQSPPEHQRSSQYLFSAYLLPSEGLDMMMSILGKETMKNALRQYFKERKFTHVNPEDAQASMEKGCHCSLDWFFKGWIHHAHEVDYRIKKFDSRLNNVTLENHGTPLVPVRVSGYLDNERITDTWIDGFAGEKRIHLDKHVDEVRLYDEMMTVNKNWTANIKPKDLVPSFSFFPKIGNYFHPEINVTPIPGNNVADGFLAGAAFTSGLFPQHHIKWWVMPMYGFESKKLRFAGEARYLVTMDNGAFDKFILSVATSSFGYNLDTHYLFRDHFVKFSPAAALKFKNNPEQPHLTTWLKYRYVDISQTYGRGLNFEDKEFEWNDRHYGVHELAYQLSSDDPLQPFKGVANIQTGQGFVRLNLNYHQHFLGKDNMHGWWVHGFGGWLPVNDQPKANVLFSFNGISSTGYASSDYMFDEWLGGRNANDGLYSRQIFMKDAELKTLSTAGISTKWMFGGGVSTALPLKYIHAYMDATLFPSAITDKVTFSYSGGLALVLLKNIFEVYIPIVESKDIRESLTYFVKDRWFDRISFQANFKLANPLNIVDGIQLSY